MKRIAKREKRVFNDFTLPNGLRIIHERTASQVAYCGFAVDAGT
ncbi:MAG: insulinase family protein, partial [Bacteroides sp.]|nr:insulinase family protein [Bacteroides sp.]